MTAPPAGAAALDASVILPTRNRAPMLAASLPRLLDQDIGSSRYEVIVVNDGSTDTTTATLTNVRASHLVCVHQPHGGRANARNAAIRVARGRVFVFVDDDVFVGRGFVRAHVSAHDTTPNVPAMVTGPIVTVSAVPESLRHRRTGEGYHGNPFPTCNGSVPGGVVRAFGGFDERFTQYGWEDEELARRLRRHGVRRRFVHAAEVHHLKTPEQCTNLRDRLALEAQRGTMGALLYTTHPSVEVAILTKTWPPITWLDRALNACLGLDARVSDVLQGHDSAEQSFSSAWRWLLLQHTEVAAASRAMLAARAGDRGMTRRRPESNP